MNKFSGYNSTDFLNDDTFICWIMKTDKSAVKFWEDFSKTNSSKQAEINEAIEIFNHFRVVNDDLSVEEIFSMWNNIKQSSIKKKRGLVINLLKYAAIFIFIFLSGALSFYVFQEAGKKEFSIAENNQPNLEEAQIIFSNGQSVPLLQKDSEIKYNSTGEKIIVNNDTITQKPANTEARMNRVIIPYGKNSLVTLSDGTKVWLNAGSQLLYPSAFIKKSREVLLIGEAFFEVKEDKEHPFIVRTEFIDVEVLGTSFDVSAYADDKNFETVLVSGSVCLEVKKDGFLGGKEKVVLEPNQRISINKTEGEVSMISEVDVSVYTSWKDGMLKFEKEDLSRILRKLERYYNKKIHIKDPLLGVHKISGKLDLKNSLADVLNVVQLTVPIDWGKQQNGDYFIVESN